ncbi:hypothetical protein CCHR01_09974 [Colletotrichum chrysophilum]|uniref:Uncharacterized protein n=1 Tax=Colletotrichum chrysophilum TaxID=1836956 RepID=A0AAD9AFS8_9PEZI|nr:hypothetical protein CCHR01_09974 [Colletotrichum chrysophilum]
MSLVSKLQKQVASVDQVSDSPWDASNSDDEIGRALSDQQAATALKRYGNICNLHPGVKIGSYLACPDVRPKNRKRNHIPSLRLIVGPVLRIATAQTTGPVSLGTESATRETPNNIDSLPHPRGRVCEIRSAVRMQDGMNEPVSQDEQHQSQSHKSNTLKRSQSATCTFQSRIPIPSPIPKSGFHILAPPPSTYTPALHKPPSEKASKEHQTCSNWSPGKKTHPQQFVKPAKTYPDPMDLALRRSSSLPTRTDSLINAPDKLPGVLMCEDIPAWPFSTLLQLLHTEH